MDNDVSIEDGRVFDMTEGFPDLETGFTVRTIFPIPIIHWLIGFFTSVTALQSFGR